VQIGAFQDEARASRVIAQLGSAPVTITTAADRLLRLRMGPFPDRAAASSAVRALQQRGFRPFVVETP
jgi:cell division septation protein DedD